MNIFKHFLQIDKKLHHLYENIENEYIVFVHNVRFLRYACI